MGDWLDDAEVARRFVRRAVTTARIEKAFAGIASSSLQLGPFRSGPIGLAKLEGNGRLGTAQVRPLTDGTFAITVPGTIEFEVKVGAQSHVAADLEIDLVLTPRPADPLLLVMELQPLTDRDVRLTLRGGGAVGGLAAMLSPLAGELSGAVATAVSVALESSTLRAARTIDIGAHLDGVPAPRDGGPWAWLSEAEFGARLLRRAVTLERVREGVAGLAGQPISVGPLDAGPGGMATVSARGAVGPPALDGAAEQDPAGAPRFDLRLPVGLELTVTLGRANDYRAELQVPIALTARATDPLLIVLDAPPVRPEELELALEADGAAAKLLARLGNLPAQLRRQVAATVNERLADASARTVDLGARIDAAAGSSGGNRPRRRPRPGPGAAAQN